MVLVETVEDVVMVAEEEVDHPLEEATHQDDHALAVVIVSVTGKDRGQSLATVSEGKIRYYFESSSNL